MDARQAREWGLSKSRLLNLCQWYKHELLVYYCICWMAMKSETWNCACIRPLLENLVTNYIIIITWIIFKRMRTIISSAFVHWICTCGKKMISLCWFHHLCKYVNWLGPGRLFIRVCDGNIFFVVRDTVLSIRVLGIYEFSSCSY